MGLGAGIFQKAAFLSKGTTVNTMKITQKGLFPFTCETVPFFFVSALNFLIACAIMII